MTTRSLFLCASVLLLLINVTAPEVDAQTAAPAIDPKATELLKQMGGYLNGLNSFSVHVQTMKDLMLPSDEALSSSSAFDLMVQRPNRFRINMTSAAAAHTTCRSIKAPAWFTRAFPPLSSRDSIYPSLQCNCPEGWISLSYYRGRTQTLRNRTASP